MAGVALQLFMLGIPWIYYGTEQALAGPEKSERDKYLPDYDAGNFPPDKYLREIMFAADHPRLRSPQGLQLGAAGLDNGLPAFGAFGTVGHHCFDTKFLSFRRMKGLIDLRKRFPVLRYGRQYLRQIANFNGHFLDSSAGEIMAWARILDDEEALCIVNGHGKDKRGGDVVVDVDQNSGSHPSMTVILNSAELAAKADGMTYTGTHAVGSKVDIKPREQKAYIEIRDVPPSEVLVLTNRPL